MASAPVTEPATPRRSGRLAPAIVTLVAFLLALLSGFLAWFSISGSSFTLLADSYHAIYVYGTQGSSALKASSILGSTLVSASTSNPIVLVAFTAVLFFWPAMVGSGLYNAAARSFGPYPFVWGLVAFVFAYVMIYYASASLGVGAYLALVAAIVFLVATLIAPRGPTAKPTPTAPPVPDAAPAGSSNAAAADAPSSPATPGA